MPRPGAHPDAKDIDGQRLMKGHLSKAPFSLAEGQFSSVEGSSSRWLGRSKKVRSFLDALLVHQPAHLLSRWLNVRREAGRRSCPSGCRRVTIPASISILLFYQTRRTAARIPLGTTMDGPCMASMPAVLASSAAGSSLLSGPLLSGFDPYVALRSLGSGSFGEAFLAHHPDRPSHLVVLKVPRGRDEAQAVEASRYLQNEAALLQSLHHPRVVPFLDHVVNYDQNFVVMTYIAGGSLADKLRILPSSRLPPPKVARLLLDVLQALEHVHSKGVLHLDVK